MSLLSPWFLVGLAAIAVPLLLHLVQREEPAGQPFPSLMFLRRIPIKTRRKKTLRDPFLLMLRCLALALLALAFAGPYLLNDKTTVAMDMGKVDRVFLLDQSYSMAYPGHWTAAIDAVRRRIDTLAAGERAAVVAFDDKTRVVQGFTNDRVSLQAAIGRLRPGYGGTDYAAALTGAARLLYDSPAQQHEVVLVSDLQRIGLNGVRTPQLDEKVGFELVSIGPATGSNAAVMDVELMPSQGIAGDARRTLAVRIRNTGLETVPSVRLVSAVDSHENSSHTFDLKPKAEHTVEIPLLIAQDRLTRVRIQLSPDGIAADDEFYLVLAGAQPSIVMLAGPDQHGAHSSFFLTQALALAQSPSFDVVTVPVSGLDSSALAKADVVILNDIRLPDQSGKQRLADFVTRGGGLLVVAADGPRGQWPGGEAGFLPGQLGPIVERDNNDDVGRLVAANEVHPLLDALREASLQNFTNADVYRYRKLITVNDDRVLARFDDGAAALVERADTSGRILVMTTTLDPRWSSLAFTPSFAPFLIETVRYLANQPRVDTYLWIGDSLDLFGRAALPIHLKRIANMKRPRSIVVESPAGKTTRLNRDKVHFSPELPGFHELHGDGLQGNSLPVAVNANRVESNLAALDVEEFYQAIRRTKSERFETTQNQALSVMRADTHTGAWWFVLVAAAIVLLLEAMLANRFTVYASPSNTMPNGRSKS